MNEELEVAKLQIEMWKSVVEVQKHFNDIELRIRGLALTVLTFALGASAAAIKERTVVRIFGCDLQLASLVLVFGLAVWACFYFVDQIWYHRLLIGCEALRSARESHWPTCAGRRSCPDDHEGKFIYGPAAQEVIRTQVDRQDALILRRRRRPAHRAGRSIPGGGQQQADVTRVDVAARCNLRAAGSGYHDQLRPLLSRRIVWA